MTAVHEAVIVGAGHALNHGNEDDVVGGIDEEPGACGAVPEERPFAVGHICGGGIKDDGAVVTPGKAGANDGHSDAEFAGEQALSDVGRGHELDGGWGEDALAFELAAVG